MTQTQHNHNSFKRHSGVLALLGLWGILLYWVNIRAGFVFDDFRFVQELFSRPGQWGLLWQYDPTRFLPHLSLAWNFWQGSDATLQFHLVNGLGHILCAFLVYVFVSLILFQGSAPRKDADRPWACWPAVFAALLFLAHPVQTSTVSYISQRSTLLVVLFYLAAVDCYLAARIFGRSWLYFLALGCGLLGVVTKPNIITLPLALVLVEFIFVKPPQEKIASRLLRLLPFALIFLAVPGVLLLLQRSTLNPFAIMELTRQTNLINRWDYLWTQIPVLLKYLQLFVVPWGLNLDYDFPIFRSFFDLPVLFSFAALAMLSYIAVKVFSRRPWITFGIVWFFLTLLPESSVFPIEDVIFEHRLYLPMLGLVIVATDLLLGLRTRKAQVWVGLAVILVLSGQTVSRNYVWSDPERLLKDAIVKSPLKMRLRYNLSGHYLRQGRGDLAMEQMREAMRLSPGDPVNAYNMGRMYEEKQDYEKAIQYYSQGTQSSNLRVVAESFWKLGYLHALKGDNENAEIYYRASLEISPAFEKALCDLGNLYNVMGKLKDAIAQYQEAIKANPLSFNGRNGLAAAHILSGEKQKGLQEYHTLVEFYPKSKTACLNLAKVYILAKNPLQAEHFLKRALAIDPKDPEVYFYLSMAYNDLDQGVEAKAYLLRAIDLLKASGRVDEAGRLEKFLVPPKPAASKVLPLKP